MKKLLGISLVAMMAVTSANAQIASKGYVDVSENGFVVTTTNTAGQNIKALDAKLGNLGDKTAAQAIADAVSGASTSYQAKSSAAYQMGAAGGTWETMTQDQQDALNSGVKAADVAQITTNKNDIATNTSAISAEETRAKAAEQANADAIAAEKTRAEGAEKDISDLVGTIPAGATATTVTGYVDEKVGEVSGDLGDLASKDKVAEADLQTELATKINGKQDKSTIANSLGTATGGWVAAGALATKDSVAETDLETALATKINGKADQTALTAETTARTEADTALGNRVTATEGAITTLNGNAQTEGSVDYKIAQAQSDIAADIADMETKTNAAATYQPKSSKASIGGANGTWTDLTEDQLAAMNSGVKAADVAQITTNKNDIATLNGDNTTAGSVAKTVKDAIDALDSSVDTELAKKEDKTNLKALAYKDTVATNEIDDNAVTLGKLSATLPSDCSASGAECVLKSSSGSLAWEVIARGVGE